MKTLATKTLTLYFIDDFTHYSYRQVENLRDGKLYGAALRLIFTVVPPPIIWTRFSNSGRHLLSMRLTDFKG